MRTFASYLACTTILCLSAASSLRAASVHTLSNPVPDGFVKIDGNINDWLSLAAFPQDTVGDGSSGPARPLDIDILQGAVAHDDNFFYFLYRNAGDNMVDVASNWIFIDLDQNKSTGAPVLLGNFSVGVDFNLGGTTQWNQWVNEGHAGGGAGVSIAAGDSNGSGGADFIEYAVSRTALQPSGITFNPPTNSFDLVFIAEDTNFDTSPNNGTVDWFTYNAATTYNPGAAGDADGNGAVNLNDYQLIQANSFTTVPLGKMGDVDDNGFVDFSDFQQWKANFPGGAAAAEAAIASLVPEPASVGLCALAAMGMLAARRRLQR